MNSMNEQWKRCHVARGLRRAASAEAILTDPIGAPPFVVAFHLEEPMSIPILAQRALWALNYVQCCVKKGEKGSMITGISGLRCDLEHNIVSETMGDGTTLPTMKTQLRIFSVRKYKIGRENDDNEDDYSSDEDEDEDVRRDKKEHYMLIVVESPIAFSLRKAIQMSSGSANRRTLADINYTDKRRNVWSDLAIHASQYVHRDGDRVGFYGACMDWLHAPDGKGFTALFTAEAAMDWAKMHFLSKHQGVDNVKIFGLESVLSNGRGDNFFTGIHTAACRKYHLEVDKAVMDTYSKKKRGGGRRRPAARDDEAMETDETEEAAESESVEITVPPPLVSAGQRVPRCLIALDVILPIPIEGPPPFDDFRTRVKNFPQFASLRLLSASMRFTNDEMLGLQRTVMTGNGLNDASVKDIMLHAALDTRSMLSGRDAELGQHMRSLIHAGDEPVAMRDALGRLESFNKGLRLTLAIVRTRATGSDNYTNERVAAFNDHFMTPGGLDCSREACFDAHVELTNVFRFDEDDPAMTRCVRMGNCDDEAQRFIAKSISSCNVEELNLKPDNLFLLMHLMYTDLMLSLDYHSSTMEPAPNGIGATVIVCDGGGNYRSELGPRYDKSNGTGADHVMNVYMKLYSVPRYIKGCPFKCNYFEELKHATELSIVQTVCNSYMGTGEDTVIDKMITEAMKRTYATEFVANNSQAAMNCMKALSWLVERNTTMSGDNGVYKTTAETDEKKGRHTFVYKPAIGGLTMLCTNAVHAQCYERFHTVAQVSRKIASSAHTVASDTKDDVNEARLLKLSGSLFCTVMCTIVNAAFAQWTGALGPIPESPTMKALAMIIHHQLDLSSSILNPDMTSADKKRFRQVSRSRSVPVALMTIAARETAEAGRCGRDHRMAVERTCSALMTEGTVSAAWWLTAELLEHTLRADFFYLMQILARAFNVPDDLTLNEVLLWIDTGSGDRIKGFFDRSDFMRGSLFEPEPGTLTRVDQCLYLRRAELDVGGLNVITSDSAVEDHRAMFCTRVADVLQGWYKTELSDFCRIKDTDTGRRILATMLSKCMNEQFKWPSMLSAAHIGDFWKGRNPAATDRNLAPLRMVNVSSGKATLGVDMRWLFVCAAIGGTTPSQPNRFIIVRHLAQRIHQRCVPSRMFTSQRLFIGMPHPDVRRGLEPLDVLPRSKRLLLRHSRDIGMDAPIVPTHMVEDLGPAAPRLQLTQMLMGAEWTVDSMPTDAAHAPLPHDMWTPVTMEDTNENAAIKTNGDGVFLMSRRDPATGAMLQPINISAVPDADNAFLYGRVTAQVRPLCCFDRPGVLLRVMVDEHIDDDCQQPRAAVLLDARVAKTLMMNQDLLNGIPARDMEMESELLDAAMNTLAAIDGDGIDGAIFYTALRWRNEKNCFMDLHPDVVWDFIVPPDTPILVDACGLVADFEAAGLPMPIFYNSAGVAVEPFPTSVLLCTLDSQGAPEELGHDSIHVRATKASSPASSAFDDAGGILISNTKNSDVKSFAVQIRRVMHIARRSETRAELCRSVPTVFRSIG